MMDDEFITEFREVTHWYSFDYNRTKYVREIILDLNGVTLDQWPHEWIPFASSKEKLKQSFKWSDYTKEYKDFKLYGSQSVFINSLPMLYGHPIFFSCEAFELFKTCLGIKNNKNHLNVLYLVFKIAQMYHQDTTFIPLRLGKKTIENLDGIWQLYCLMDDDLIYYDTPSPTWRKVEILGKKNPKISAGRKKNLEKTLDVLVK